MKFLLSVMHENGHFTIVAYLQLQSGSREHLIEKLHLRRHIEGLFLFPISPEEDAIVRLDDETSVPELSTAFDIKVALSLVCNIKRIKKA